MSKVRVGVADLDGEELLGIFPAEDTTSEEYHDAWREFKKQRDRLSDHGILRGRLAVQKRLGHTWGEIADAMNFTYGYYLWLAVRTHDPLAKEARAWLEWTGLDRDRVQVQDDLDKVARSIDKGKFRTDRVVKTIAKANGKGKSDEFILQDGPATLTNVRTLARPLLEELTAYLETMGGSAESPP